jgi:hypothetical protein
MKGLTILLIASAAFAQSGQPNVSNARFEARAFSGDLGSEMQSASATWFGYAVKMTPRQNQSRCWNDGEGYGCSLEGRSDAMIRENRPNTPIPLEGPTAIAVLFRVENNTIEKIRVFTMDCPLDGGGLPFVWITGVPETASVAYLEKLIEADSSNHRVTDGAILAISQHDTPGALDSLIRMARRDASPHIREQALFWLAQRAGERAAATIQDAILNDPETAVKKRAVFALSQLPRDEGIPKLIEVARRQRNPEVRKQAFFWLGQSKDPRALAFIEEVLTK